MVFVTWWRQNQPIHDKYDPELGILITLEPRSIRFNQIDTMKLSLYFTALINATPQKKKLNKERVNPGMPSVSCGDDIANNGFRKGLVNMIFDKRNTESNYPNLKYISERRRQWTERPIYH